MSGEEFSSESDDSESGEEPDSDSDSEEDDDEAPRGLPLSMADLQNGALISSDDEEDDSSSEEESEEEGAPTVRDIIKNEREIAKRKKETAQTPQPQKKAKTAELPKAPATAPAKSGGATPGTEAEFADAVRAFLEKNGPTKLAILGSNVKRPASASKSVKLKALVTSRPEFEYKEDDQTVSLA